MAVVTFDGSCTACGACLLTCPTHAIRPQGGRLVAVAELCTGCGECIEICPADAIALPDLGTSDIAGDVKVSKIAEEGGAEWGVGR